MWASAHPTSTTNEHSDKTITSGTLARSKQKLSSDDIIIQILAPSDLRLRVPPKRLFEKFYLLQA
jgi:hypothetical protein